VVQVVVLIFHCEVLCSGCGILSGYDTIVLFFFVLFLYSGVGILSGYVLVLVSVLL
jgi:hypothetical protein